jgi:HEAT repeat protein
MKARHAIAILLAAIGCTPSAPPPVPPPPPVVTPIPAPVVTPEPPPRVEPAPAPVSPSPPPQTTSDKPAAPLRDLAARLVESDGSGGWRIDEKAATELEKLGPEASAGLVPLLADERVEVRRGAAFYLLGTFDAGNPEHVAAFTKRIEDQDRAIRGIGLAAIKQMRPEDQQAALPKLAAAAESDPDPKFRSACLVAIAQAAEPAAAIPHLVKALADQDASVRLAALARLRALGPEAAAATKAIGGALEDADVRVRDAAASALIRLGEPAVAELAARLSGSNIETRKLALAALAKIGPAAKAALPAIEKCKSDADPVVKQLAEAAARSVEDGK